MRILLSYFLTLIKIFIFLYFFLQTNKGVIMTILQGGLVRRLPPNITQKSAVFGLYLIIPAFILVGIAKSSPMLYAGMIFYAMCKYKILLKFLLM